MAKKLRRNPQCNVECCLSVTMMLYEAKDEFGGIDQGASLSTEIKPGYDMETPGVQSSLGEMGLMEVEIEDDDDSDGVDSKVPSSRK